MDHAASLDKRTYSWKFPLMPERIIPGVAIGTGVIWAWADSATAGLNATGIAAIGVAIAGAIGYLANKFIQIYKDAKAAKLQTDRDRLVYDREKEEFLRTSLSEQIARLEQKYEESEHDKTDMSRQVDYLQRQNELLLRKVAESSEKTDRVAEKLDKQADKIEEVKQSVAMQPLVLVVEDDRVSRENLSELLVQSGYQVIGSESSVDAIRQLEQKPASVILDITLKDGPGWPVMQEVRRLNLNTKIIVISGYDVLPPSIVDKHSIDHVIKKPVDLDALLKALSDKSAPKPHQSDLAIVAMSGSGIRAAPEAPKG